MFSIKSMCESTFNQNSLLPVFIVFVKQTFFQDGPRIEAAFRKYFRRADVEQVGDSVEVFVCHSNVIRYFVCRYVVYCWFSSDVMAAMLVYSYQKNFDYFFCLGHQNGHYVYCLLYLLGLCQELVIF